MLGLDALTHAVVYGDSAYPSGRYTLSHGLEGLVQAGRVTSVADALAEHLRITATPGDGVATATAVLLAARGVLDPIIDLDQELLATKITKELRQASVRVGKQTLQVHRQVHPDLPGLLADYDQAVHSRCSPGNQAIALGLIHHSRGLDAPQAVAVELTGLAVGWGSAALRLRQCDHIGAQAMVEQVEPLIHEFAEQAATEAAELINDHKQGLGFRALGRASPGLDLASAQHEHAPARLFMS